MAVIIKKLMVLFCIDGWWFIQKIMFDMAGNIRMLGIFVTDKFHNIWY